MTKPPKRSILPDDWKKLGVPLGIAVPAIAAALAAGSWFVNNVAFKDSVAAAEQKITVVQVQVKSIYDVRIEQLRVQRDRLLRAMQTPQTRADLVDIERELEIARQMRDAQVKK